MFLAIDGTGPELVFHNRDDDFKYALDNRDSHVSRMHRESSEKNKRYFRGPTTVGENLISIVDQAMEWLKSAVWTSPRDTKLYLFGHSRGGLGVIEVARRLKALSDQKRATSQFITKSHNNLYTATKASIAGTQLDLPDVANLQVVCVALFDCVDRDPLLDATDVPANVQYCFHAMRNPAIWSRISFSNDATYAADPTKTTFQKKFFWGTHAALGGTPWTGDKPSVLIFRPGSLVKELPGLGTIDGEKPTGWMGRTEFVPTISEAEDRAASFAVWRWMSDNVSSVAQTDGSKRRLLGDPSMNWS